MRSFPFSVFETHWICCFKQKTVTWLCKWAWSIPVCGSAYSLSTLLALVSYRRSAKAWLGNALFRCSVVCCCSSSSSAFFLTHTHKVFQTLSIRQHGAGSVIYVPSAAHQHTQGQLRTHACLWIFFYFSFFQPEEMCPQNNNKNTVRVFFYVQYVFCFNEVPQAKCASQSQRELGQLVMKQTYFKYLFLMCPTMFCSC